MQPEALESKVDDERQRRCHVALPGKRLADPVAQARRLRNAAPNVRQAYAADQGLVMREDEKIIRLVNAPIFGITRDSRPKIRSAECIGRPIRLPRRKEISGARAQARPCFVIAALRRAQKDAIAGQSIRVGAGQEQSRKGFSLRRHLFSVPAKRPGAPAICRNPPARSTAPARPWWAAPHTILTQPTA